MRVNLDIRCKIGHAIVAFAVAAASSFASGSAIAGAAVPAKKDSPATKPAGPVFEADVVPILKAYCWRCHGGEGREAGLDMRTFALLAKGGKSGPVVVPGSAEKSPLVQKLASGSMPPRDLLKPTAEHVALIRRWIDNGAAADYRGGPLSPEEQPRLTNENRQWWAFRKPVRSPLPRVNHADRVRTPVDAFLLERLEQAGLEFSPDADRATLIRRLSLDVLGLPPEPRDVEAFVADKSPDAYERLVERLLSSPHYGETWGRHWLDAAGYVDTMGSDNDAGIIDERVGIWKYRDYVIRSFNDDKPYDRFLLEQLAGDELVDWRHAPAFTPEIQELLTATGFLRQAADVTFAPELNTADIRNQVLYDTVQILSANVLGLTMHCAQCHTHKFDPISHVDYYRFAAILSPGYNVQNWTQAKERCLPEISSAEAKVDAANTEIDKQVNQLKEELAALRRPFEARVAETKLNALPESIRADVKGAVATPAEKRGEVQKYLAEKLGPKLAVSSVEVEMAMAHEKVALSRISDLQARVKQLAASKRTFGVIQAFWDVDKPSPAYLHRRGNYQTPGAEVRPGFPAILDDPSQPFAASPPQAGASTSGYRSALARWLTRADHPLTARVIVNRVWQNYFGRGIVATPENFGASGQLPTHPQLLDWLATEFVRNGWSFKHLHRLILMSTAYRQTARLRAGEAMFAVDPRTVDPENLLLWQMPLRRLDSEAVRDRVLAVSGSLDAKQGGPPVPLKSLPDGRVVVDAAKLAAPGDQYRRSIYIFARRNYQLTEMSVFDQPKISHNCTRRVNAAVVLQSLTMLNGEFLGEQAEKFAARVRQTSGVDDSARVKAAFNISLCRDASPAELDLSRKLLADQRERYLAESGLSAQAANDAALVELCHMLLNANEFLYLN